MNKIKKGTAAFGVAELALLLTVFFSVLYVVMTWETISVVLAMLILCADSFTLLSVAGLVTSRARQRKRR